MQPACIAVAYSGGRDSTALLHATLAALRGEPEVRVVALHVHHGLMARADDWLQHCDATCRRWARRHAALSFAYRRLDGRPSPGESVEAWARRERYRALAGMAGEQGASAVLLAHHRRDQAETLLLQALRGAGVAGLAGMPRIAQRDGTTWLRPWLEVSQEAVAAYARRHRLRHVDDDSNDDPRFSRNRLRHAVWPALSAAFPAAESSLAMAARWSQQARQLLIEVASEDLARIADKTGLSLADWMALSESRRINALRAWLERAAGQPAPASLVQRLLDELPRPGSARWPFAHGELRRYRGRLSLAASASSVDSGPFESPLESTLSIRRAGRIRVQSWAGTLHVVRVDAGGVALARLTDLRVVGRRGGEQFQRAPGSPPRSLKKQYQALGLAAWERDGPLLYAGDDLVFVAGLGIDARVVCSTGEPQVALHWDSDAGPRHDG